jgi:predicted ATP-dependent endonuclease of OLD family
MASLFRVALALYDSTPNHIIVVDEPELSLHPQAQKQLASVISRFASDRQIIITTHSPYFVNWSELANGAKIYRLTQEKQGISIGSLQPATIANLERLIADWQKPNLLDAVAREVFFADEVVFFEGQEDVGLVRKFTKDRELPAVASFGYGAGGFGNIRHFLKMADDLRIPAAAVYDGDHAEAKEQAENEFPNAFIEVLPTPDIRDKPTRDERGRETDEIEKIGIFDRNGVIKAEHEAYLIDLLARIQQALVRSVGNGIAVAHAQCV